MRVTLSKDELLKDLILETGIRSKNLIVRQALEEMLLRIRREKLKALRGKLQLDVNLEAIRKRDLIQSA